MLITFFGGAPAVAVGAGCTLGSDARLGIPSVPPGGNVVARHDTTTTQRTTAAAAVASRPLSPSSPPPPTPSPLTSPGEEVNK